MGNRRARDLGVEYHYKPPARVLRRGLARRALIFEPSTTNQSTGRP